MQILNLRPALVVRVILYARFGFYTGLMVWLLSSCAKETSIPIPPDPSKQPVMVDSLHDLQHMLSGVQSKLFSLALKRTGYDTLLSQFQQYYTLMVPTDSAFIAAGYNETVIENLDVSALSSIIGMHIWNGSFSDSALNVSHGYVPGISLVNATYYAKLVFFLDREPGGLWVNGKQVSSETAGVRASNGYIHSIDQLLKPPTQKAWDILQSRPEFSYFVAACRINDSIAVNPAYRGRYSFYGAQTDSGLFNSSQFTPFTHFTYTCFIPTNDAFIQAGFKTIDDIRNYGSTYVNDPSGNTVSPLDTIIFSHFLPGFPMFYFDIMKNPNLNLRVYGNTTDNVNASGYYNESYLYDNFLYVTNQVSQSNSHYPYIGLLNYQYDGNKVSITCNSSRNPSAAVIVEPDIVAVDGIIHGVDHLFWPY